MTGVSIAAETSTRVLGLGNDILADDALGLLVARQVAARFGNQVEVVSSSQTGFHVMDELLGVSRLLVVDCIRTGAARPGTGYAFNEVARGIAPPAPPRPDHGAQRDADRGVRGCRKWPLAAAARVGGTHRSRELPD